MNIIKLTINDIQRLQKIANICFRNTYKIILTSDQMEYMINWMYGNETLIKELENNCFYYLIEYENEDVGYFSIEKKQNKCELHKIYVLPQKQHLKIGSFMMNFIKNWSKENNCESIYLNVNRNNSAIQFYTKMGFRIIRTEDNHIGNGYYMNDYVMEFIL